MAEESYMQGTLEVRIITSSEMFLTERAEEVILPGEEGVLGILPQHVELIASLKAGIVRVVLPKEEKQYFTYEGIAEVHSRGVNVVTSFAIDLKDLQLAEVSEKLLTLREEIADNKKTGKIDSLRKEIIRYETLLKFIR